MAQSAVMKKLRDSMKWIFILIIVFFVASMVFQRGMGKGSGNRGSGEAMAIAVVNGEKIETQTYAIAVENAVNRARQNNNDLSEGMVFQLREQAWQELINRKVIGNEMKKKDVDVTPTEITEEVRLNPPDILRQQPSFQTDGVFDYNLFLQYAKSSNADPNFLNGLESMMMDNITSAKLQNLISSMSLVTRHSAIEDIFQASTKVKARYMKYSIDKYFAEIADPTESQLQQYFEANKAKYVEKDGAILNYAFMPLLVMPRDSAEAKAQIDTIYHELITGGDFEDLAVRFSEDKSAAQNNGRLGWVTKGRLVPEFEEVIFSMDSGQVSEPFLTNYGWHIAKVENRNDSLDAVLASHILVTVQPGYETVDSVSKLAEEVQSLSSIEGMKNVAQKLGITYETTDLLDKNTTIPGLGYYSLINTFALEDTVGAVYEVIASNDGYYVFQIAKQFKKGEASFENVRSMVLKDYRKDAARAMARRDANADYEIAKESLTAVDFDTTGLVSPYAFNPEVGYDPVFTGALLGAQLNKVTPPIEGAQGSYYLIEVIERENPSNEEISGQINMVYNDLKSKNDEQAFGRWFKSVKKQANIKDNRIELWRQ